MAAEKPSKSEAIRNFKAENPDAGPKAIAEALNKKGFQVSAPFVSTVLSTAKKKGGGGGKGRGRGGNGGGRGGNGGNKAQAARTVATRGRGASRPSQAATNGDSPVVLAARFVQQVGGMDEATSALEQLAEVQNAIG